MNRADILSLAVEKVKSLGYECYFPVYESTMHSNNRPTYCFITDGTNIGYMQSNHWGCGMNFSTVHVPNSIIGSGCSIGDDISVKDIDDALIKKSFSTPVWVKHNGEKYKSWEDFVQNSLTGKISKEIIKL